MKHLLSASNPITSSLSHMVLMPVYKYISTMIMTMIEKLTEICHTCVMSTKLDFTGSIYLLVDY